MFLSALTPLVVQDVVPTASRRPQNDPSVRIAASSTTYQLMAEAYVAIITTSLPLPITDNQNVLPELFH